MLQSYSKSYTVYYYYYIIYIYIYIWIWYISICIYDSTFHSHWFTQILKKNTFQKLRLGGGLDGLPNEGIQMQIGRSPSHSASVTVTSQDGLNGRNWGKLATKYEGLEEADPHVNDSP